MQILFYYVEIAMIIKKRTLWFLSLMLINLCASAEKPLLDKEMFLRLSTETTSPVQSIGCNLSDVVDSPFRKNHSVILEAVKKNGLAIRFADPELYSNKEIALAAVKQFGRALEHTNLQDDEEVVRAAVKSHGFALEYASDRLKKDTHFLLDVMRDNFLASIYIIKHLEMNEAMKQLFLSLRANREQVLSAVKIDGVALSYVAQKLRGDKEIVLQAMKHDLDNKLYFNNSTVFKYADDVIKDNKTFALKAVTLNIKAYDYLSDRLKQDQDVVLTAIRTNAMVFDKLPAILKTNEIIILATAGEYPQAYQYANKELRKDKVLALRIIKNNKGSLKTSGLFSLMDTELKKDKDVMLAAVKNEGKLLQYASKTLRNDKKIVLQAVDLDDEALRYASQSLQGDKEVVLKALRYRGKNMAFVSPNLKNDKAFILKALAQMDSGAIDDAYPLLNKQLKSDKDIIFATIQSLASVKVLEYATSHLRKDKEVVYAALKKNGYELEFADNSLKKDRAIVLTAISQTGSALKFADASLKKDKAIVIKAIEKDGYALEYADVNLQMDKELIAIAGKGHPNGYPAYAFDKRVYKNKTAVLAILEKDPDAIQYVDESLKSDRDIILATLQSNKYSFYFNKLDPTQFKWRDVALLGVARKGEWLKDIDKKFQADRAIVLAAVKNNGSALQFAAVKFKNDRDIVLAAVKSAGDALRFAATVFNKDKDIMIEAVRHFPKAIRFADKSLINDAELLAFIPHDTSYKCYTSEL